MEYLEGHDLDTAIAGEGVLPVETAVDYVLQACEALAEAHTAGIVHRDLKPANLFLTQTSDGSTLVKLLDFGISKYTPKGAEAELNMTKTRALMGSPLYMAPEQMRSTRRVDHRADIWSVGIVLHEILTGQMPFVGATLPEVCAAIAADDPIPVRKQRPDLPSGLEAVILRCLQKKADQRYADVGELANALLPFGPPEATLSVKRITRIIQGLGTSMSLAPTPTPAPVNVYLPKGAMLPRLMTPGGGVTPATVPTPDAPFQPTEATRSGTKTEISAPRPSGPSVNTFAETIGIAAPRPPWWRGRNFVLALIAAAMVVPLLALRASSSSSSANVSPPASTAAHSSAAEPVAENANAATAKPPTTAVPEPEAPPAVSEAAPLTFPAPHFAHPAALPMKSAAPRPSGSTTTVAPGVASGVTAPANAPEPSGTAAFGGSRE
jgi:serine/threonine-protein kinase